MMTPNLYTLILFKIALFATISAIVGISSWKIMGMAKKGKVSKAVSYYIVTILVVVWFLGMGWIITLG